MSRAATLDCCRNVETPPFEVVILKDLDRVHDEDGVAGRRPDALAWAKLETTEKL